MNAVLFDLDDTLYPEMEFVESGFRAVGRYLCSRYPLKQQQLVSRMLDILQRDGRGKVFDTLLQELGIYSADQVKTLVYVYRSHQPALHLYEDVLPILERLRRERLHLGIVTDGMVSVQRSKIAALGLHTLSDVIVCTDELGKEYWKPSGVPFQVALQLLQVSPTDAAYVGNDVGRDFAGPNSLGMLTIRIDRPARCRSRSESPPELSYEADVTVEHLTEIVPIVARMKTSRQ